MDWNAPPVVRDLRTPSQRTDGERALVEEYTIETPENVTFLYEVAGVGSRAIGAMIDVAIVGALLMGLLFAIAALANWLDDRGVDPAVLNAPEWAINLFIALYFLLNFAIFWGYFLLFELFWNGQTPGKRVAKTRVVRDDGMPAGFAETAVRNLVRIIDWMPAFYGLGLLTMFLNNKSRRLGDYAGGTLVVHDVGEITLDSIINPPAKGRR